MKQFVVAEAWEGDGQGWKPPTPEERERVAQIMAEKLTVVRVFPLADLPLAYQGFQNPRGSLGSHVVA